MKEQNEQRKLSEINRPMNEELFNNLETQYQALATVKAEGEQIEKQAIEEMAKVIDEYTEPLSARDIHKAEFSEKFAKHLYTDGYRKQSEGEWIEHGEIGAMNTAWECSVCHWKTVSFTEMKHSKFCPNCGAKMKGGAE